MNCDDGQVLMMVSKLVVMILVIMIAGASGLDTNIKYKTTNTDWCFKSCIYLGIRSFFKF